jgi:hypothetical protein
MDCRKPLPTNELTADNFSDYELGLIANGSISFPASTIIHSNYPKIVAEYADSDTPYLWSTWVQKTYPKLVNSLRQTLINAPDMPLVSAIGR